MELMAGSMKSSDAFFGMTYSIRLDKRHKNQHAVQRQIGPRAGFPLHISAALTYSKHLPEQGHRPIFRAPRGYGQPCRAAPSRPSLRKMTSSSTRSTSAMRCVDSRDGSVLAVIRENGAGECSRAPPDPTPAIGSSSTIQLRFSAHRQDELHLPDCPLLGVFRRFQRVDPQRIQHIVCLYAVKIPCKNPQRTKSGR